MKTICIRTCILAVLLAGLPAQAETFHSRGGVVFERTLRKVVPQAADCNVLEQNHPPNVADEQPS